jgi:hypothetical protein
MIAAHSPGTHRYAETSQKNQAGFPFVKHCLPHFLPLSGEPNHDLVRRKRLPARPLRCTKRHASIDRQQVGIRGKKCPSKVKQYIIAKKKIPDGLQEMHGQLPKASVPTKSGRFEQESFYEREFPDGMAVAPSL